MFFDLIKNCKHENYEHCIIIIDKHLLIILLII